MNKERLKSSLSFAGRCISALGLGHCVFTYGFDFSTTEGGSMSPVIPREGTVLFFEKITPRVRGYKRGDVVVANSVTGNFNVCKRVAGLPGDLVTADILGKRKIVVPPGHVWLVGDNRELSVDSRSYGPVPMAMLSGVVRLALYPSPRFIGQQLEVVL